MRRPIAWICFSLCLCIAITGFFRGYPQSELGRYEGKSLLFKGRVERVTVKSGDHFSMELKAGKVKVLADIYSEDIESPRELLYRTVEVQGKVVLPAARSNPNCFDYRRYLQSRGIHTILRAENIEADLGYPDPFHRLTAGIRNHTLSFLEKNLREEAFGLMAGILFGTSEYMDEEDLETARRGGTAHILAVSGMHLGIIYAFLCRFGRKKRSGSRDACILGILFFYGAMTGFSPSVVRAVMLIAMHVISRYLHRRYDMFSGLCACAAAVLIVSPQQIYSPGFRMTFIAAFSMAVVMPVLNGKRWGALAPVLAIQAGMLPYQAYVFNYVSFTAFLANIPVAFLAGLIVPAGILTIPLSYLPAAGTVMSAVLSPLLETLRFCNDLTYMEGLLTFDVVSPPVPFIFLWYAAIFVLASDQGRIWKMRGEWKKAALCLLAAAVISIPVGILSDDGYRRMDAVFVDVGQGDCVHIRSGGGNYLIDGGGSSDYETGVKVLKPYLLKNGVSRVDGAFVTHLHTDHYKGICELAREGMVERIYVYEANRLRTDKIRADTGLAEEDIVFLRRGHTVSLGGDNRLRVLWPEEHEEGEYRDMLEDEKDENSTSLILRAEVDGVSILITGDLGTEGEGKLIDAGCDLKSDVLKVGHHGSKYSSSDSFLDRVAPDLAVIQVKKNNTYGHPAPDTLRRLEERNISVKRNDLDGAVGLELEKGKIGRIRTMYERRP